MTNPTHYRNGLLFGHAYADNYGFGALMHALRFPSSPPSLATSAPDFSLGALDAALSRALTARAEGREL